MRAKRFADLDCAIAQAAAVVGDWWSLLIVRDIAGGVHRFEALCSELQVSRRVLSERLAALVDHGVVERRQYQSRPPRDEYWLTAAGNELLPVLIALQDWGGRFVSGDGSVSATSSVRSAEARRVRQLDGKRIPELTLSNSTGGVGEPVASDSWTTLLLYPGAYATSASYPPRWDSIPGARGCTLELTAFAERQAEFEQRNSQIVGVSTQRPDEQAAFAKQSKIHFPLFSDEGLQLAASLRLPTFRVGGVERLKRAGLIVDPDRVVRRVLYPITDPAAVADDALRALDRLISRDRDRSVQRVNRSP